jgi:hypothetical protein
MRGQKSRDLPNVRLLSYSDHWESGVKQSYVFGLTKIITI